MATNWNEVLSNTNNLNDVLSILKKVLAGLEVKADSTTINEALQDIEGLKVDIGAEVENVNTALDQFQTQADEVIAQGFYKGFATETALKASLPTVSEMRARADDTRKIWRWNRTSAVGVTPITGTWIDTGLSDLDQSKNYTDTRINFVDLPETNQFVKELHVTGWNGTNELYLMSFNGNDNGKVTIRFKDKTANLDAIYTYQKAQGLQIYPLETSGSATGSGFGGYIVVDWNKYTTEINAQGAYTYKVNKKALNLVNCPFIKEYLDLIPINAAISANASEINSLKQANIYRSTLSSTATHLQTKLINSLVSNVKLLNGYKSGFSYFINNIELLTNAIRVNVKYFDPANPEAANTWASYNMTIAKGSLLVEPYELKYESYRWLITVDWNYFPQLTASIGGGSLAATPLNTERLFEKDTTYLLRSQPNFYKVGNAFKDGQSKLNHIFANAIFSANGDTNYSYAVEKVADGTRVVLSNVNANVNRRFRFTFNPFYVRIPDSYFVYMKYTVNSISGTTGHSMSVALSRSKTISTSTFFDNVINGKTYEEVRKMDGDLAGAVYTDGSLFFDLWAASNSAAGVVLDITIHDIRLLYNYAQDPIFINKERKEVEQLVRALGYFEDEVTIPKFVDTALVTQNINKGLEMQSLGDSTSVMVMWQERLSQMKGWHFNRTMAINGLNGGYPTALGGSWCEPIISNFGGTGNAGQNHYTRSTSIASYNINVLFVLSSYNGQHPGKAWQSGGQLVKADHGINDAAYLGAEVNLITNPTADFPSFAASYYGMLEKLMTSNPNTRIVLLTMYLFNASESDLNNIRLKNAVIRKASDKYSLQLIDLEKISGINSFTANTLSFDGGVHINQQGGDRLAQVIGGIA